MRVEALEVAGRTRPAAGGRNLPVSGAVELRAGDAEPEVIVETRGLDARRFVGRSQGVKDRLRFLVGNRIAATAARAFDSHEGETPSVGVLSEHHSCRWAAALRTGRIQSQYPCWRFRSPAPSPARQRAPHSYTPRSGRVGIIHFIYSSKISTSTVSIPWDSSLSMLVGLSNQARGRSWPAPPSLRGDLGRQVDRALDPAEMRAAGATLAGDAGGEHRRALSGLFRP